MFARVIRPCSSKEVQSWMAEAFQENIRVYPVSTATHVGNGSNVPWAENCCVMDLSGMNQILDFNEELGFIEIQPGVTQEQLVEFLKSKKSNLMPALTGSYRQTSLMGNALERGDAFGAFGERAWHVSDFEVVLPNGELYYTDQPCGPNLEGLFFQSNLGIVTRMRLWLEPKPDYYHQVVCGAESLEQLSEVIDVLRGLQQKRIVSYVSIWDSNKAKAKLGDSKTKLPKWIVCLPLFAFDKKQAKVQLKIVKQILKKYKYFQADSAEFDYENSENLTVIENGLLWVTGEMDYLGERVCQAAQITEQVLSKHGFESRVCLVATHPRRIKLIVSITYDAKDSSKKVTAEQCQEELLARLILIDCLPFRLNIQSRWASPENTLYERIKGLLDPDNFLSPGHYERF